MNLFVRTAAVAACVWVSALAAQGAPVGTEDFNYADGPVAGRAGGTGWAAERTDEPGAPPSGVSDWDNVFGAANVAGGQLVTQEGGAKREYNGPGEGVTEPSNEREGAFRGAGTVFYAVDITRQAGAAWSGASSYDFGAERIFWGVPGNAENQGPNKFFGIDESGVGITMSTVPVVEGRTYRLVTELNFDTDRINLWIDPTLSDLASPDASRPYTGTNWSTAVRLASGGTAPTSWDNLVVATSWNDLGLVPEPSSLALAGIGALALLRRRR